MFAVDQLFADDQYHSKKEVEQHLNYTLSEEPKRNDCETLT